MIVAQSLTLGVGRRRRWNRRVARGHAVAALAAVRGEPDRSIRARGNGGDAACRVGSRQPRPNASRGEDRSGRGDAVVILIGPLRVALAPRLLNCRGRKRSSARIRMTADPSDDAIGRTGQSGASATSGIRLNSFWLRLATGDPIAIAVAATRRSCGPTNKPRAASEAHRRAWTRAAARSNGRTGKSATIRSTNWWRRKRTSSPLARSTP